MIFTDITSLHSLELFENGWCSQNHQLIIQSARRCQRNAKVLPAIKLRVTPITVIFSLMQVKDYEKIVDFHNFLFTGSLGAKFRHFISSLKSPWSILSRERITPISPRSSFIADNGQHHWRKMSTITEERLRYRTFYLYKCFKYEFSPVTINKSPYHCFII